ncbi:MAG: peptide deformylase [Acidobacteria bacterium]|nr:peptide deformylase [Acidobacteriota bacterium]
MAIRRILQLGDPLLRVISAPVTDFAAAQAVLADLDDTLGEFRRTHGFGRGISAIQIGAPTRVILLRFEGTLYELINPTYAAQSPEMFELWDDCFSFPNLLVRLQRHCSVRIRYQDRHAQHHELTAEGSFSELIQHEMDHLDGILAVDRAPSTALATRDQWLRQQRHRS